MTCSHQNERSDRSCPFRSQSERPFNVRQPEGCHKKNLEHYKAHPTITFNSNYQSDVYKIFAYFVTEVEPYQTSDGYAFDYHNYLDLSDKAVYEDFISNINERSQIVTSVDVRYGDEFLTLSTCSNEFEPSRFVIFTKDTKGRGYRGRYVGSIP